MITVEGARSTLSSITFGFYRAPRLDNFVCFLRHVCLFALEIVIVKIIKTTTTTAMEIKNHVQDTNSETF